jgi:prolyl-tRNA synthetase
MEKTDQEKKSEILTPLTKKSNEGLTIKKEENFSEWFTQLIIKSKLADYSSVSGCMILRPSSYFMWEKIKEETDKEFKKIGVQNSYFPLFIPESILLKENKHNEGFAPEVAWVTQGGNTKLGERLAIRPTSEAIMYEAYSKWIRSWRDLPLLLNQWNNVVRWEFNNPVLFFRTREFLWNELHTAFSTEEEALKHGIKVIKAYNKITKELMALPGLYGRKTESEKFAGGVFSEKVHHYIPGGKIIEGTCFHHDGQNFAKAYNIKYKNKEEKEGYAWQNTHAISTRMLGTMFAIHSDNKGLVIPPKIAPNKIVIIPLKFESNKKILEKSKEIEKELSKFEPILDERLEVTPGYKFNEWELKGIPLRIEIGPKELEEKEVTIIKRNNFEKIKIKIKDLKKQIPQIIESMQKEMYNSAEKILYANIEEAEEKNELIKKIKEKKMVLVPLCKNPQCEEHIRSDTEGAKALFIDQKRNIQKKNCIICGKHADYMVYIGKTY